MRTYATIDALGVNAAREQLMSKLYELRTMDLDPWDEDCEAKYLRESAGLAGDFCRAPWSYIDQSKDFPF